ncbi:hypothetical protein V6N12_069649 [Hibiscus sabdariffa]|uniref:Uncharacterized protein n=1 Tax=Hibiscus sabdariffa TaxID=183260 RepID=A0ABR2FEL3_9ROSI
MSRTHFLQNPSPFPNLHGLSSQSLSLHSSNHSDELRSTTDFSPSLVSDRLHLDWLERLYMSAVTESLRADDRVRLLGKEMGLCGVEMGLDEADA